MAEGRTDFSPDAPEADRADRPSGQGRQLKQQAEEAKHAAKEKGVRIKETATLKAEEVAGRKKDTAVDHLERISRVLRSATETLREEYDEPVAQYGESAAAGLDRAVRHLRENDVRSLTREVEQFGRRRPELFLGAALVAGIVAGRFLRASSDDEESAVETYAEPYVSPRPSAGYASADSGYSGGSAGYGTGTTASAYGSAGSESPLESALGDEKDPLAKFDDGRGHR